MAIVQKLNDLGFANCSIAKEADGVTTVRVRTSKGWVYEKFTSPEQVQNWAQFHKPESE